MAETTPASAQSPHDNRKRPLSGAAPPRTGNVERDRTNSFDDELFLRMIDELRVDRARAGLRALALAPNLEVYHALMRGEAVPVELLNADAVMRYGVRA